MKNSKNLTKQYFFSTGSCIDFPVWKSFRPSHINELLLADAIFEALSGILNNEE